MLIDRRNAVQNQTFAHWLLPCPRWNLGSSRRPPRATRTVMPPTPTAEEDEYNPAAILLTSGLLHSFIQGMIISQVGRYYEDYYHLDTLLMKLYVGSIVVVSLCVFHRRSSSCNPNTYCMELQRADDVHQLQNLGGDHSSWRTERRGMQPFSELYFFMPL